ITFVLGRTDRPPRPLGSRVLLSHYLRTALVVTVAAIILNLGFHLTLTLTLILKLSNFTFWLEVRVG
ncbi:putative transmembrane protein, partial [Rhizoctonia solani 123E]